MYAKPLSVIYARYYSIVNQTNPTPQRTNRAGKVGSKNCFRL